MNNDLIHINTLPPFKRMCVSIGNLPTSFMESMTYYEALEWLYNYLDKTVIPAINTEGEAITELQTAFVTLKNYVDNYFENLDVQKEINNKLDEMAESGELADIIAQYLGLAGVLAYNTVADMKLAQNLVNGSTAKTLGYYNLNDGGSATYKIRTITNDDVVDEMTILSLYDNTLIAELVIEIPVNPLKLGAHADSTTDDSAYIQKAINLGNVIFPRKTFKTNSTITINGNKIVDLNRATIISSANPCFKINTKNASDPLSWINIKNGRIEANYNGIECYDSYFIKLENLTIKLLEPNITGILFENGFNNDFINVQIYGLGENNNCVGIKYAIDADSNANIPGITNLTNIKFEDCLIQRVGKGIELYGETGGSYDSNCMINNGFSYCHNVAIDMNSANLGGWDISTTRCESSNLFIKIGANNYVNLTDLYLLNTNGIENAGFCSINGAVETVVNNGVSKSTINDNTGSIRFGIINRFRNTNSIVCSDAVKATTMSANTKYLTDGTGFFPQFVNLKYTGNQTATVANIVAPEGGEMFLLRRTGDAGWLLPNNTYTTAGVLYHLIYLNGVWNII